MKKIAVTDDLFEINGLPCFRHNRNKFWRLPLEAEECIGKDLWECSKNTSGARIRFSSDTGILGLRLDYGRVRPMDNSNNMCRIGEMGMDVYVDGKYWNYMLPGNEGETEEFFFENVSKELRQFTIYLPLYHPVDIKMIIVDDDAVILPPAPFSISKPVVFYGTSITQGGCASRAGLAYQAILARDLNIDFINLGFSGMGKGEARMAEILSDLDASCYVLDYAQNNKSLIELEKVYEPFLMTLRRKKPKTPIILTTPILNAEEMWNVEFQRFNEARRDIIRSVYNRATGRGDSSIHLLEGAIFLPMTSGEGLVDRVHPNDIGFYFMSMSMKKILTDVLSKSDQSEI